MTKKTSRPVRKSVTPKKPLYLNPALPIAQRVEDLLSRMTLEEKAGQMLHEAKAIERLAVPSYVWWNECLHGVGRAGKATVFPQAIGLAATFDARLMKKVATAISDEARAKYNEARKIGNSLMYTGLTFWSPNINIFRDPRWGRGHETYGEDPFLTARMGVAFIQGLQGDDEKYMKVAACAKHYAVHSGPEPLRHTFDAKVSAHDLWDTYLPAFQAAVAEAKVESVMGAYNRTNGDLCCAHPYLIGDVLRTQWKFDGHYVSDCGAIEDFHVNHRVTNSPEESVAMAVKNGCDLCCGGVYDKMLEAVKKGILSEQDIDACVRRLLTTRFRLGMFDPQPGVPWHKLDGSVVNCKAHRKLALKAARESIVLLKNNGALPLKRDLKKILVVGPNYDSIEVLLGNYNGLSPKMTTILEGIVGQVGAGTIVAETRQCPLTGDAEFNAGSIQWHGSSADAIVAVMGLSPRIEGEEGDAFNADAGGDRRRIELPAVQQRYLEILKTLNKPIILVIVAGSAVAVPWAQENCDAILQVWYSGEEGGTAVAEVLFGEYNPAGRMPVTVPVSTEQLPAFEDYSMANRTYRYAKEKPLYPFGHGLSYTTFAYSKLKASSMTVSAESEPITLSVRVDNTGNFDGDEVVQVYIQPKNPPAYAPRHWLASFQRVNIEAKDKAKLEIVVPADRFAMVDENGQRQFVPGQYTVHVGGGQPGFAETLQVAIQIA